jgi:hypothetical protein
VSVEALSLAVAAAAGAGFGALHLGLLWLAVRRRPGGRRGAAVFLVLGLARAALLLGALAAGVALGASAAELVAAALGFLAVRLGATRVAGPRAPETPPWR